MPDSPNGISPDPETAADRQANMHARPERSQGTSIVSRRQLEPLLETAIAAGQFVTWAAAIRVVVELIGGLR